MSVLVVGAGIFGVAASLALRTRGHDVRLIDPGPIPYEASESFDLNKVVRLDYGADEEITALMENALERWREWNRRWESPLFHETGVMFVAHGPMQPGGFEHDSMELLLRRGHRLERLDADAITRRFSAFAPGVLVDGYFNPNGGWAASGDVVARLVSEASAAGVVVEASARAARLLERGSRIVGVEIEDGTTREADVVVVAAGSWTAMLCPWLAPHLVPNAQPVFYLAPEERRAFEAGVFPVFGADIAVTGFYGFPVAPNGLLKIANHGPGRSFDPSSRDRSVNEGETEKLRAFLRRVIPSLANAPIASSKVCAYCDTRDGNFWIAPDPDRAGLVVAAGGSGHGFKFAPVIGDIIADATEGNVNPRFRWRTEGSTRRTEAARASS